MTQEEINEYNHRCALSIGGKQAKNLVSFIRERLNENDYWLPIFGIKSLNQMKFHLDWNWIMKVVEAIEKLGYRVEILNVSCCIYKYSDIVSSFYGIKDKSSKKEAVVQTINQFLIWYSDEQRT